MERWLRAAPGAVLAILAGLMASGPALAAGTTVYKCIDKGMGVLYTDEPCAGEQINIPPGNVDPAALALLQRERDALARATAQRLADYRRASIDRASPPQPLYAPFDESRLYPDVAGYAPYLPYGYEFVPPTNGKRTHRDMTRSPRVPRTVANPPHVSAHR
jgi:hypothetical protein